MLGTTIVTFSRHPYRCLGFHCICLLGCKLGVIWFNWILSGKSEFRTSLCLAEPDVWQRCTLWFAVSLCLLSHSLGAQELLGFRGLRYGGCPWGQGSGNPHPHGDCQSTEGAAKLVVTCGLYHLPLRNADILFGSWIRLEKNVLNGFNEVC